MSTADAANLILLIGPGFIAIQVVSWINGGHRLSDAQRLTWSVICSVALFLSVHGILRALPWKAGSLRSPAALFEEPFSAPVQFVVGLYVVAALSGWAVGKAFDGDFVNRRLARLGLDPLRHRDVWRASFRESRRVNVYLDDGTAFNGWAEENSSGVSDEARFVRIAKPYRKRVGESWKKLDDTKCVLIPATAITYIHFKNDPPAPAAK